MSKNVGKVGNPQVEQKLEQLLKTANEPVSIDYVAYNLGISWITARAMLLELTLQGKIKALKTTKSWVFYLPKNEGDNKNG